MNEFEGFIADQGDYDQGDRDPRHIVLVVLRGDIDAASVDAFNAVVEVAAARSPHIVFDMKAVTFLNSSGLTALLQAKQSVESRDGIVTLRDPTPTVQQLIEMTGLTSSFIVDFEAGTEGWLTTGD